MIFDPNILFFKMHQYYEVHKNDSEKVIFCNEGSSRSSKTWDFIHFVVWYCDHHRGQNKDIYFLRDTLINCRDFTLKEVQKCFSAIGIPFNPTFYPKPYLNLWGNNIYFRGLDDEKNMEGFPSDISFVNEALDVNLEQIIGILMRCVDVFAMDWNPKVSDHWAFNFEKRPNCLFTHSTFKDNKHLPISVIREIESYDPSNPENINNGTADDYRWKVYGLGERCAPSGLIFPNVTWIDEFPQSVERIFYGLDFGYTQDPSALVKIGVNFRNIYLQNMLYLPVDNAITLANDYLIHVLPKDVICWCDSSAPGMIGDLRALGFLTVGIEKFPGCVTYRNDVVKRYKIHIVRDPNFRKEQENYRYRVIQGITLNEPIDKYNHLWDATGGACQHELR